MHILIEGTMARMETKVSAQAISYNWPANSSASLVDFVPKDVITQEAYKIIVDSREIILGCIDCASRVYYCNGPGFNLTLTEKVYNELVRTLNRLNIEEALLLNALMIEKKKDVKDIKEIDLWSKQKVNALLGIMIDE